MTHPFVAQPSKALDEDRQGNAFDRIKVDTRSPRYGVRVGVEKDLTGEAPNRGGARGYQCAPESGYGHIAR